MKIRFGKGTLLLFISFWAMSVCSLTMLGTMRTDRQNREESRRNYSDYAATIVVSDCNDDFWEEYFKSDNLKNAVLYTNVWDENYEIKGIYGQGNFKRPHMIAGNFDELFIKNGTKNCAVVGKNLQSQIYIMKGQGYIDIQGESFRVAGIMGVEYESRINDMIYINFSKAIEFGNSGQQMIMDSRYKWRIDSNVSHLQSFAAGKGEFYSNTLIQESMLSKIFENSNMTKYLFILVLISFWLSTVIIVSMWLMYKKKEISIKDMMGFCHLQILGDIAFDYLKISVMGYLAGIVIFIPIGILGKAVTFKIYDIGTSLFLTVVLGGAKIIGFFLKMIMGEKHGRNRI